MFVEDKKKQAIFKPEPSSSFLYGKATLGYREKNRENHDIIYFHDQTKGERDEEAREFFLENMAYFFLSCRDRYNGWRYLELFLPKRSGTCCE
jgi:hypothetical protein